MNQPEDAAASPLVDVYLGLGSNQGAREAFLADALARIRTWPEVGELEVSGVYESDYVGPCGPQAPYVNLCARLRTALGAQELVARTQELERSAGRERTGHQRPRSLDIDLLLHGEQQIEEPGLRVPHPRLRERRFVLQPLCELRPDLRLPPDGTPVATLLAGFAPDEQPLRRWEVQA